jgi:hypothetical protein
MSKLAYNILVAVLSNETLKLVFNEELDFVRKHRWLFLERHIEVIFALNSNTLSVAQLGQIQQMMEQVRTLEEQQAAVDRL